MNVERSNGVKIPFRLLPGTKPDTAKVIFSDFDLAGAWPEGQYARPFTLIIKDVLPQWYKLTKKNFVMSKNTSEPNPDIMMQDGGYVVTLSLPELNSFRSFWGKFNKSRHEK